MAQTSPTESITLAGGCFWCLEAVYEQVHGVVAVESGYSNGEAYNPTYEQVCQGDTGHAEVVKVDFDPALVSLRELLEVFFSIHDPTTRDRQGNDVGPQYRSGIYTQGEAQAAVAREVLAEVNAATGNRAVTELAPLSNYWRAEGYHQHYFAQHPGQGYCAVVVAPKVEKFRHTFGRLLKSG